MLAFWIIKMEGAEGKDLQLLAGDVMVLEEVMSGSPVLPKLSERMRKEPLTRDEMREWLDALQKVDIEALDVSEYPSYFRSSVHPEMGYYTKSSLVTMLRDLLEESLAT